VTTLSKRERVMGRSQRLGHCICDPRKPCPCDVLLDRDVCLCAGERLEEHTGPEQAALTKLVKNAGCASKIAPADLARVLSRLPRVDDPRVLVGTRTADDAGVFQVSQDLCLVQTVDVFAPCVDDPYQFGQIAACNSLSDCYAMGGLPLTALSIIGYPLHALSDEWMYQMLKGGMDKLEEAGVALVGGHSLNDEEVKLGFAITGLVSPRDVVTNAGAQPGDVLILTKGIGTGVISFAAQVDRASRQSLRAAADSMTALNRAASEVMCQMKAHACTDVTGFGLLGHLCHVVRESGVTAEVWWDAVPLLPQVWEYAAEGLVSGAAERNREFAADTVQVERGVPEPALDILYDPQTSGGLLISVAEAAGDETLARLRAAGCSKAVIVGRIRDHSKGAIVVTGKGNTLSSTAVRTGATAQVKRESGANVQTEEACCPPGSSAPGAGAAEQAFSQFMGTAFAAGALDVVQKELTTIALSVAVGCEPCLRMHLDKARGMGIAEQEIQEAAWMGVAFGGAKAMMLWRQMSRASGTNTGSEGSNCCV